MGNSVWRVGLDNLQGVKGFVVNGGYFVVEGNMEINTAIDTSYFYSIKSGVIQNINLSTQESSLLNVCKIPKEYVELRAPIGFCYSKDSTMNGTYLPIPKPYRKYFGVIVKIGDDIHLTSYENFINVHETIKEPIVYFLDTPNTAFVATQDVIKMNNGERLGLSPVITDALLKRNPYEFAYCSGPILVNNGQVVFDTDTMLKTEFVIQPDDIPFLDPSESIKPLIGQKYHIIPSAKNNKMFIAEEKERNQYFGMRHSARFMVHNVIAQNDKGDTLFFITEGRGFDSPGMDRVQLAHLVKKFNIKTAISLDGGFSANGFMNIVNYPNFNILMNDPELRELGVTMLFTEK